MLPATIANLLAELNIPADYGNRRGLPLCPEATELESIGDDIFGREQRLIPEAAHAWRAMRQAARADGIALGVASAFRTVAYQAGLIRRKLERGQSLEEILAVSAAPGFSEHHTGRALDIATPGSPPLEEEFAETPAYAWLRENASRFGFSESYPKDNCHGICWEPWHWCFKGGGR